MTSASASPQTSPKPAPGLIDLPVPPLTLPSAENAYRLGETVLITLMDGSKVKGALLAYRAQRDSMFVRLESRTGVHAQEIRLRTIRTAHILQDRKIVSLSPTLSVRGKVVIPPVRQEFEVVLDNDERLSGHTFSYRVDRNGLHLYPGDESGIYTHLFVSSHAIRMQRVGPLLGEALAEEHLVTYDAIKAELAEQHKRREKPIGEYLISARLVTTEELEAALEHQRSTPQVRLGEILVRDGAITEEQLAEALRLQEKDRKTPLGEMLVAAGLVSAENVKQTLAKKIGIPFIDLRDFTIDAQAVRLVDGDVARKHQIIPLYVQDDRMVIAMEDPMQWQVIEALRACIDMGIDAVMATASDLAWAIEQHYGEQCA